MGAPINLAGVELEHPLMNAAGTCKSLEDVRKFARSAVSAITVGSITLEPREVNHGNVYFQAQGFSLSSLGMPNLGKQYYMEHLPEMVEIALDASKPLVVSIAGFRPDEYGQLADIADAGGADIIEVNLGCPNVWADGRQKPIPSFDPSAIQEIINNVNGLEDRTIGVKLSPYSDPGKLAEVAAILNELPVGYVVSCNAFPNALLLDSEHKPVIDVGLAGLTGAAMLPIGLGQVAQLREVLDSHIQIVGVGGISSREHISAYLSVGAVAVQASTVFWNTPLHCNPIAYSEILMYY
jgi:dihydroorotate dehydrogenase (fumarate)